MTTNENLDVGHDLEITKATRQAPWLDPRSESSFGFSFTSGRQPKRRIAPKALDRFQERIRELTCRTRGVSLERMIEQLTRYLTG